MTVFISTGGFSHCTAFETASNLLGAGIFDIELSAGRYEEEIDIRLQELVASSSNILLHNYFPPPQNPFVLNLASKDSTIYERSINHVINSIRLCSQHSIPLYSVHAGFCVDPKTTELGKTFKSNSYDLDRSFHLDRFYQAIEFILNKTSGLGVRLLVENNCLNQANFLKYNEVSPLLLVDSTDLVHFNNHFRNSVGILLDVGHLNVTCHTKKLNRYEQIASYITCAEAYHLSENNGLRDANEPISLDSWFISFLKPLKYITLEVYRLSAESLLLQQQLAQSYFDQ